MLNQGAARLRSWRKDKGLTQAQVCALLAGAEQAVYSAFERGTRTLAVAIERVTEGFVTVESWDEPAEAAVA